MGTSVNCVPTSRPPTTQARRRALQVRDIASTTLVLSTICMCFSFESRASLGDNASMHHLLLFRSVHLSLSPSLSLCLSLSVSLHLGLFSRLQWARCAVLSGLHDRLVPHRLSESAQWLPVWSLRYHGNQASRNVSSCPNAAVMSTFKGAVTRDVNTDMLFVVQCGHCGMLHFT